MDLYSWVPSIRPHLPSSATAACAIHKVGQGKGKGQSDGNRSPRSPAVRKLDELLAGLRSSSSSLEPTQHSNNSNNSNMWLRLLIQQVASSWVRALALCLLHKIRYHGR
jgi:hypothetical protein